jgi:hypothetical protein
MAGTEPKAGSGAQTPELDDMWLWDRAVNIE